MPLYYFHMLRGDGELDADRFGADYPDHHAAAMEAANQARDLTLRGWSGFALQVHDDEGTHVVTVPVGSLASR